MYISVIPSCAARNGARRVGRGDISAKSHQAAGILIGVKTYVAVLDCAGRVRCGDASGIPPADKPATAGAPRRRHAPAGLRSGDIAAIESDQSADTFAGAPAEAVVPGGSSC